MAPRSGWVGGTRPLQQKARATGRELDQPHPAARTRPPTNPPMPARSLPRGRRRSSTTLQGQAIPSMDPTRPAGRWLPGPSCGTPGWKSGEDHRLEKQGRAVRAFELEFKLPQSQLEQQFFGQATPASSASPLRRCRHPGARSPRRPWRSETMAREPSKGQRPEQPAQQAFQGRRQAHDQAQALPRVWTLPRPASGAMAGSAASNTRAKNQAHQGELHRHAVRGAKRASGTEIRQPTP